MNQDTSDLFSDDGILLDIGGVVTKKHKCGPSDLGKVWGQTNLTRNDYSTAGRETLPKRADLWFGNWFNLPRYGAQAVWATSRNVDLPASTISSYIGHASTSCKRSFQNSYSMQRQSFWWNHVVIPLLPINRGRIPSLWWYSASKKHIGPGLTVTGCGLILCVSWCRTQNRDPGRSKSCDPWDVGILGFWYSCHFPIEETGGDTDLSTFASQLWQLDPACILCGIQPYFIHLHSHSRSGVQLRSQQRGRLGSAVVCELHVIHPWRENMETYVRTYRSPWSPNPGWTLGMCWPQILIQLKSIKHLE